MKNPLITVVIPTYNREKTILESVNSVLQQTYDNIELLIIDDCSTDETKRVLGFITDKRLNYIKLDENSGANVARNKGIMLARGEYIAFNDSDDTYSREKLQTQFDFLQKTGADIVLCRLKCFDESGANKGHFLHHFPKGDIKEGQLTYEDLLEYNSCSTQTIFGKTKCFLHTMFDETIPRMQDWDEILRLSQKYKVFYQKKVLAHNFLQSDSISKEAQKGIDAMQIIYEKHKDTVDKNPVIKAAFALKLANFKARAGQPYEDDLKLVADSSNKSKDRLRYILHKLGFYKLGK